MEHKKITLNEEQRNILEKFVKNGTNNSHLITRAKVILDLDRSNKKEHMRIGRICEHVDLSRQAVNDIRKAFLEAPSMDMFLQRKKRETPPVEPKVTGEVEAHVVALACSEPPTGYAKWTLRLLAHKSVEMSYIESIGSCQ